MKRGVLSALAAALIVGGAAVAVMRFLPGPSLPAHTPPPRATPTTALTTAPAAATTARPQPAARATAEAAAGEPFVVELLDPPEQSYGIPQETSSDRAYAAIVAKLGRPNVTYDPILGRAARELALQQSLLDGIVPSDIVEFILRSSGAVDRAVDQGYVATSGKADDALVRQLEKLLAQTDANEPLRIGIGEAWLVGSSPDRVAGVLVSHRGVLVDPAPRRVERGATWTLAGTLPARHTSPNALVLRQDGTMEEVPVALSGDWFRVDVPVGTEAGTLQVSLGAIGPFGHTPLVQVPVEVGGPIPVSYTTRIPADEAGITSVAAAEALALSLLNGDRARFGLPGLSPDPALAAIARAHSEEMRDRGFFGHVSPRTGGPGDRLSAARYRAVAHGENVALHGSLHEAEAALLASLGHRKNILTTRMSHVGVGVAISDRHGRRSFHVTQLFAAPVQEVNEEAVAADVRARMNARRAEKGLGKLAGDGRLDRIARTHAEGAARGESLDGLSKRVLASTEAEGLSRGGARVWALRTGDVSDLSPSAELVEGAYARVGVGVAQDPDRGGAVFVVVVAAAP